MEIVTIDCPECCIKDAITFERHRDSFSANKDGFGHANVMFSVIEQFCDCEIADCELEEFYQDSV